jgi:hypothetical protein
VREQNPHQTPSRRIELEGELYLARSRRRRIRPESIPADLRAALADPNMYTRLGAVTELRARLASDNLPAAAGAYEALAELARTATRYLADPAADALSEAVLRPAQTQLHFGRVQRGSAPPHRIVQMLGPPIARACVPHPSHDWIRVDPVPEGLDISIDTAGAGLLNGTVAIKGTTGEAVIAVDIELIGPPPPTSSPHHPGGPITEGTMAPVPVAGQLEGQSASPPPPSQKHPAPQLPTRMQPGQQAADHQPGIATAPGAETGQQDTTAPAIPAPDEAPHPAQSQQRPARESAISMPERQSSAPIVWAAGSAILGVLLVVAAVLCFVNSSSAEGTTQLPGSKQGWLTILAVAVLGALITGFERPFKQLRTLVHCWNFIWFICLALYLLFHAVAPFSNGQLVALTVVGLVGNAICATLGLVLIAKGDRSASNISLCITTVLITAALAPLAYIFDTGFITIGPARSAGVLLFAASFASLLESVVVLARRPGLGTGADAKAP